MKKSEWVAIDLHTHTAYGYTRKKGKEKEANIKFSYLDFIKAIMKYDIKLISTTNHNWIDMTNFILIKYLCNKVKSNALMGVELDNDLSNGKSIHVVCIFSDVFESNYSVSKIVNAKTMEKIKNNNLKELIYTDDEIIKLFKNYDLLLVPHGDKAKGMLDSVSPEQAEEVFKKVREGFIHIFDSPSNWKLEEIKDYLSSIGENDLNIFGGVLFSDNKDWANYEFKSFYMNAEPTYKGIIHSSTNPVRRFKPKQNIEINSHYISRIEFAKKNELNKIMSNSINLSGGYNCIIGKSGSGKSLLLYIIKRQFLNSEVENKYSFIENTDITFFDENGKLIDKNDINISMGENLFDKIITASTIDTSEGYYKVVELLSPSFNQQEKFKLFKNKFKDSIMEYFNLNKSINANLIKLSEQLVNYFSGSETLKELKEIQTFSVNEIVDNTKRKYNKESIDNFNEYADIIENLNNILDIYNGKYKQDILKKIKKLEIYLKIASKEMNKTLLEEELFNKKINFINFCIRKINGNKSRKAEQKSKLISNVPKTRNAIISLIIELYILKLKKSKINLSISIDDVNSTIKISDKIIVKEYLNDDFFKNVNEKDNGIFNTYGFKQSLSNVSYNLEVKEEANKLIEKYISIGVINDTKNLFTDKFIPKVDVLFDNQDIRKLNPGTIAKEYLNLYFDDQVNSGKYNVILFDQIENDVDKEFISTEIRKFIETTKGKLQLIIVTHDPIVAVNADPNNYIVCVNDKTGIKYRDFVAESSVSNELETIAKTVDGSEEVIKRRYEIYDSVKSFMENKSY